MVEKTVLIEETAELFASERDRKKFVIMILAAMRENITLLDSPDYKRLYDEALDFLFRDAVEHHCFDKNTRASSYILFETCADGYNKLHAERISEDIIKAFLNKRRKVWNGIKNGEL